MERLLDTRREVGWACKHEPFFQYYIADPPSLLPLAMGHSYITLEAPHVHHRPIHKPKVVAPEQNKTTDLPPLLREIARAETIITLPRQCRERSAGTEAALYSTSKQLPARNRNKTADQTESPIQGSSSNCPNNKVASYNQPANGLMHPSCARTVVASLNGTLQDMLHPVLCTHDQVLSRTTQGSTNSRPRIPSGSWMGKCP